MKKLPNILSIFRICLVPFFIICFFLDDNDIKYFAVGIFIIANISDVLDGIIARRYNAQTELGKILDPLGDKLITFSAILCITISRPVLIWAVCIFFIKEILMGIGGLLIRKRAKIKLPPSNILGKTSTVLFFTVCFLLLVFGEAYISNEYAVAMMAVAVSMGLIAFTRYLFMFMNIMKNKADGNPELSDGSKGE